MEIINNLTVKVTYNVGIGGLEVSDELYSILTSLEGEEVSTNYLLKEKKQKAMDWLSDNIRERDALDWTYEIEEIN